MMKNKGILKFIAVLFMFLVVTGCGAAKKVAITGEDFSSKMTEKGYKMYNYSVQEVADDANSLQNLWIAKTADDTYQIEFYSLVNNEYADTYYEARKQDMIKANNTNVPAVEENKTNYSTYSVTTDVQYTVAAKIGTTYVFAKAPVEYKDAIVADIKALGY